MTALCRSDSDGRHRQSSKRNLSALAFASAASAASAIREIRRFLPARQSARDPVDTVDCLRRREGFCRCSPVAEDLCEEANEGSSAMVCVNRPPPPPSPPPLPSASP
jgi:hypothetical protein